MEQHKTGQLIRTLRLQGGMTQRQLASALGVTEQAVSKWERGLGCPDVSVLPVLARALEVSLEELLAGELEMPEEQGGTMKTLRFYLCPQCGSLMTATGTPEVTCCGSPLTALTPQKPDEAHRLVRQPVEDEWFFTAPHPMEKGHYLSFFALVNGEEARVMRRWPEWELQLRLPRRQHGLLYWYCTRHGLFREVI